MSFAGKIRLVQRAGLPRTDYDRIESAGHRSTRTTRAAPAIATASSISAAGKSRLKVAARLARTAAPPRVPPTAPAPPRASPTRAAPPRIPKAAPARSRMAHDRAQGKGVTGACLRRPNPQMRRAHRIVSGAADPFDDLAGTAAIWAEALANSARASANRADVFARAARAGRRFVARLHLRGVWRCPRCALAFTSS